MRQRKVARHYRGTTSNQLPAMGQGNTPRTYTVYANATGGANQINARGLGVTRTLTLLDGRRVVGSGMNPAVDINMPPQNLVQRVDVVTGGASAAYGSDAVAGVVNFILDSKFTGIKGNFNVSQTDYSDGRVISGDLAFGAKFAGDRGHVLLSGAYSQGRWDRFLRPPRLLVSAGPCHANNPNWTATNGQSGLIVRTRCGHHRDTGRRNLRAGPLKGIMFLPAVRSVISSPATSFRASTKLAARSSRRPRSRGSLLPGTSTGISTAG